MGYFFQREARMARLLLDLFVAVWFSFGLAYLWAVIDDDPTLARLTGVGLLVAAATLPVLLLRLAVRQLIDRPAAKWQPVPPSVARRHPLYGTDGWGLLPPVVAGVVAFFHIALPVRIPNEGMQTVGLLAFSLLLAGAFFLMVRAHLRHRPYAPLVALGIIGCGLLFNMAEAVWWANQIPDGARSSADSMAVGWAVTGLSAAIGNMFGLFALIAYLDRSRRINVTFGHLVPVE